MNDDNLHNEQIDVAFNKLNGKLVFDKTNSNTHQDNQRKILIDYMLDLLKMVENEKLNKVDCAYIIAGLMSSKYVIGLNENDQTTKVLEIAGQLELPEAHRDINAPTWEQFSLMIKDLK